MSMIQKTIEDLEAISKELGRNYIENKGEYLVVGKVINDAIFIICSLSEKIIEKECDLNEETRRNKSR